MGRGRGTGNDDELMNESEVLVAKSAKIRSQGMAAKYTHQAKQAGIRVVMTNGCFDTFHAGHLETLRFARRQGDILIVAVNTDESIRTLKGPCRPIYPLEQRMEILAAIDVVDYVVPFGTAEDPSVEPLVRLLEPDVLVKGGDYTGGTVVGAAVVEHSGGRVVIGPKVPGVSTTQAVEAMKRESVEADRTNGTDGTNRTDGRATSDERRATTSTSHPWLFVDLDGTIADPFTPMARLLKLDLSPKNLRGRYDLGKVFDLPDDYFAMFGPQFWESAPWMEDGQAIWRTILEIWPNDRILLCSSPTRECSSAMGKLLWLERHLSEQWHRRYCLTPFKEAMDKNGVLLDDCDENTDAFQRAGGRAILVPRAWNAGWEILVDDYRFDTVVYVRDSLRTMIEEK